MKVLVATEKPFAAAAVEGIRKEVEGAGNELVLLEKYTEKAQLLDAVKDADALIIRSDKCDAEVLDAAKQLKIVVRAGAGFDNIDLAAATAHGVVAENTPGQNSNAVAELVFGMLEPGHYAYVVSAIAENNSFSSGEVVLIEKPFEIYFP
jgi:D-3-phosphoglycerate dehydrogenase